MSKVFPANGLLDDDDNTSIFHVSEMQIGLNEFDHGLLGLLKQAKPKNKSLKGDSNPDLSMSVQCSTGHTFRPLCGLIISL